MDVYNSPILNVQKQISFLPILVPPDSAVALTPAVTATVGDTRTQAVSSHSQPPGRVPVVT